MMNKAILIGFTVGILIGLFIGGIFWQKHYLELSGKYQSAIELLQIYKHESR